MKIKAYLKPQCGWSNGVRAVLRKHGLAFEDIDIINNRLRNPMVQQFNLGIEKEIGGLVGRIVFEPGWRWSDHVKPIAGTDSCQAAHTCYFLSGRMKVVMDDGEEIEYGPGDFAIMPRGHDAWIVGDEACILLDFGGLKGYAQAS